MFLEIYWSKSAIFESNFILFKLNTSLYMHIYGNSSDLHNCNDNIPKSNDVRKYKNVFSVIQCLCLNLVCRIYDNSYYFPHQVIGVCIY